MSVVLGRYRLVGARGGDIVGGGVVDGCIGVVFKVSVVPCGSWRVVVYWSVCFVVP